MKELKQRNGEIVSLINKGISYRNIAKVLDISLSRVERINKVYNKEKDCFCVRCGRTDHLVLDEKIRNLCKNCVKELINL